MNQRRYWCPLCTVVYIDTNSDDVCPYCGDSAYSPPPSSGSTFNPLIVLPGSGRRRYDLHYEDTAGGSGLRPLPPAMAQSLLRSGLESILDYLWANVNFAGSPQTLPTIRVDDPDSICAVCTDDFAPGSEAFEMPCSHRYHAGCILPWLRLRRSCPMCRGELPIDTDGISGLALWKLPSVDELAVGSFVVARGLVMPTLLYRIEGGVNFDDGGEGSGIEWRRPTIRRRRGGGLLRRFLRLFSLSI